MTIDPNSVSPYQNNSNSLKKESVRRSQQQIPPAAATIITSDSMGDLQFGKHTPGNGQDEDDFEGSKV